MSVNRCIFIGNLGRDAELRYTSGGVAVASFSIACNEVWNDKNGQKQERVEWVRVALWGKTAESVAEYLTKGKQVYVEGKMNTRKWQDKEGNDRYTTEIRADRVQLLGGTGGGRRARQDDEDQGQESQQQAGGGGFEDNDDVPF